MTEFIKLVSETLSRLQLSNLEVFLVLLLIGETYALYRFWNQITKLGDRWSREYQALVLRNMRTVNNLSNHLRLHHMQVINLLQARGIQIPIPLLEVPADLDGDDERTEETVASTTKDG